MMRDDRITHDAAGDGIDRRGFLKCMAWAGTGLVWTVGGGILGCRAGSAARPPTPADTKGDFTFVQISDSHIGFSKEPNKDVTATLQAAIDKINALPEPPDFLLHTGDLTHLSEAGGVRHLRRGAQGRQGRRDLLRPRRARHVHRRRQALPGALRQGDAGRPAGTASTTRASTSSAWSTWRTSRPASLGVLGREQLDWLKKDVAGLGDSTPVVVFAHVPLWTVYEKWGWGTEDSAQALALLKRFGSVTVLNGHIHQVLQKVEGKVTFHTARSTAFPQPEPGKAESPGPIKNVAADKLKSVLGVTQVSYVENKKSLATVDSTLE